MKKNTLAALILTTLAAGQITSLQPQSVILKSSSTLR